MATKTITTSVTIHAPGEHFKPFKWDGNGGVTEGRYHTEAHPPGTPVTLEAAEADAILAKFGGKELSAAEVAHAAAIADETAPPIKNGPPTSTSDEDVAAASASRRAK